MPDKLTTQSFLNLLKASGLSDQKEVKPLLQHFPRQTSTAGGLASLMVSRGLLSDWQASKLLDGRHIGFLLGPYRLKSHLARGGMSTLYVAQHTDTGEVCALKVLSPKKADEASYLPRFIREAELASRLEHENVVRVFEFQSCTRQKNKVHFMAMELLHGRDLFQEVSARGPLPWREAAEIIRQAAEGLQHAHDCGLVHRDVKPGNLFLTDEGRVKIVDLGLASALEGQEESLTRQFDERVLGTADYLAPEQAIDSHRADSRADIYALGCTFYFALTGHPPFTDGSLAQRILAHQTKEPRDVRELRSDVPDRVLRVLKGMLLKRRANRIQTCREVADFLNDWLRQSAGQVDTEDAVALPAGRRRLRRIRIKGQREESPTDPIRASESETMAAGTAETSPVIPNEGGHEPSEAAGAVLQDGTGDRTNAPNTQQRSSRT